MRRPTAYFIDIDGVIVEHLGRGSGDQWDMARMTPLPGAKTFCEEAERRGDQIILVTARPENLRNELHAWLRQHRIVYHQLVMGVAGGNRILVNDAHPAGTYETRAVILQRNEGLACLHIPGLESFSQEASASDGR